MRKFWFLYLAKALIVWPGGFGTLDELMELLTLIQTKKIKCKIIKRNRVVRVICENPKHKQRQ